VEQQVVRELPLFLRIDARLVALQPENSTELGANK